MHYYKRNIGDYAKKAGRLTMLQHGAYTLLLDACYDREKFPTIEEAIEWTWASNESEIDAVKFVLNRFFSLDKDGQYIQDRILDELLNYHKNADTNKRIAIERETKRREKSTNRGHFVNDAPPNQEPITKNHKPRTKNHIKGEIVTRPESVDEQLWNDWLLIRKKKNAPLTQSAWELMIKESEKASLPIEKAIEECCLRNWQSFKADWVKQDGGKTMSKQQALEARNDEVARQWLASKRNQT